MRSRMSSLKRGTRLSRWHNIDVKLFLKVHELDKPSVDGTSRYVLKAVDEGVETCKNNSQQHLIREEHHLGARRRGTRNGIVSGAHIFKNNLVNV